MAKIRFTLYHLILAMVWVGIILSVFGPELKWYLLQKKTILYERTFNIDSEKENPLSMHSRCTISVVYGGDVDVSITERKRKNNSGDADSFGNTIQTNFHRNAPGRGGICDLAR